MSTLHYSYVSSMSDLLQSSSGNQSGVLCCETSCTRSANTLTQKIEADNALREPVNYQTLLKEYKEGDMKTTKVYNPVLSHQLDLVGYQKLTELYEEDDLEIARYHFTKDDSTLGLETAKGNVENPPCPLKTQNKGGESPLHRASQQGDLDTVKVLITREEWNVNIVDEKHNTPLHSACTYGHHSVVEFLIANQRCQLNSEMNTPLHLLATKKC